MGKLQDMIDNEWLILADKIQFDVCSDKWKTNYDRCGKCSFVLLLGKKSREAIFSEGRMYYDLERPLKAMVFNCAKYIFQNGGRYFDEFYNSEELKKHIDNIDVDQFYKDARPFEEANTAIIEAIRKYKDENIVETICVNSRSKPKRVDDLLEKQVEYLKDYLKKYCSYGEAISLSSYIAFNKRYDEEWYEICKIN